MKKKKTAPDVGSARSEEKSVQAALDDVAATGPLTSAERERLIAELAYFRAQARGFAPGDELADWTAAEAEVDARFSARA